MQLRRLVVAVPLLLAACVSHIDAPQAVLLQNLPFAMVVVSGDGQSAPGGAELTSPLVVRVEDSKGHRVTGQIVVWRVVSGGGSVFAGVAITNKDGEARERWTLGASGAQRVEARAVDPDNGNALTFGVFNATVLTPAQLSISETNFNFGSVALGTTSTNHSFTVTNVGGQPTGTPTVSLGGTNGADFRIASNSCTTALAGGALCTIAVNFRPTISGASSASLSVSATPGGTVSAALSGSAPTPALLEFRPPPADFGSAAIGTPLTQTVTLFNSGGTASSAIALQVAGTNASEFTITPGSACQGASLQPAMTCSLQVVFTPTAVGTRSASLSASATSGGTAAAPLTGTGLGPAQLQLSPAAVDFGPVTGGSSASKTLTLGNTGGVASGIPVISISGANLNDFTIESNACTGPVGPTKVCTFQVRFTPSASGTRTATVTVTATASGTTSASLTGTGAAGAVLQILPLTYDFGLVAINTASAPQTFTITNIGSAPTQTPPVLALSGTNVSQFGLIPGNCGLAPLIPNGSCSVQVVFAPTASGSGVQTAVLTASAGPSVLAQATLAGTVATGTATLVTSLGTWNYGLVAPGQRAYATFVVSNTGTASSGPVNALATGQFAGQFLVQNNTCGAGLAPAQQCSIQVMYVAGSLGPVQAPLAITSASGASASVALAANAALVAPQVTVLPMSDSHNYGTAAGSTFTFGFVNNGSQVANVALQSIDGGGVGEFTIVNSTCFPALLGPLSSCQVVVQFNPSTPGLKAAGLELTVLNGSSTLVGLYGIKP